MVTEKELPLDDIGERYGSRQLVRLEGKRETLGSLKRYGQTSPVVVCQGMDGGHESEDNSKEAAVSAAERE